MNKRSIVTASILLSMSGVVLAAGSDGVRAASSGKSPGPCRAADFRAVVLVQGAMGHREGGARLTNRSSHVCTVHGYADVRLTDARGRHMMVHVTRTPLQSAWESGLSKQILRQGLVRPGARAFVQIRWGNWCGFTPALPISVTLRLPQSSGTIVEQLRSEGAPREVLSNAPPCNGRGAPSSLDVGPLTPVGPGALLP